MIVGFPVDEGVRRNKGRTGAAMAPEQIRDELYRMTPDAIAPRSFASVLRSTHDVGNLRVASSMEVMQERLGTFVATAFDAGIVPIILGGGHETAFGHFLGYAHSGRNVEIINIDAHADVRELVEGKGHSGSPFRQALEHDTKACRRYSVAGLQPMRNAEAHIEYLRRHGSRFYWADEFDRSSIDRLFVRSDDRHDLMVTIDMDAIDQTHAPGVSAPCAAGLDAGVVLEVARIAGRTAAVRSLDIVEVNPMYDADSRTSRLAARIIWSFLRGLTYRLLSNAR